MRPSEKAVANHLRPGERIPVERKFGQAKNGYGMNRIRVRLKQTSQSWITSIILVLSLVKLAGMALACLGFSAWKSLVYFIMVSLNTILQAIQSKTQSNWESGLGFIS